MKNKILQLKEEIASFQSEIASEIEEFRIKLLGQKGSLKDLFEVFKGLSSDEKREVGQLLNELKNQAKEKIDALKEKTASSDSVENVEDLTKPGFPYEIGAQHPVSIVRDEIIHIFQKLGFEISEGPEIEDDWHNFSALNFPPEHPARDMQDTFFIEKNPDIALRTHTSSVQVRVMENSRPPIRTISPGRVFRNEAISTRSHCIFHQVEGLYIDTDVSFEDLKQTLFYFAKSFFGDQTKIRFRPSYFPFTEPSAEMDVSCFICDQKGCRVCKHSGWVEILGCGMVDPNVLENCKIDSNKYSGYAFGMGIERPALLKYQIDDIRLLFENDLRFIKQFSGT